MASNDFVGTVHAPWAKPHVTHSWRTRCSDICRHNVDQVWLPYPDGTGIWSVTEGTQSAGDIDILPWNYIPAPWSLFTMVSVWWDIIIVIYRDGIIPVTTLWDVNQNVSSHNQDDPITRLPASLFKRLEFSVRVTYIQKPLWQIEAKRQTEILCSIFYLVKFGSGKMHKSDWVEIYWQERYLFPVLIVSFGYNYYTKPNF